MSDELHAPIASKTIVGDLTWSPNVITFNAKNTEVFRITAEGALVKGAGMSDDDCTNALFEAISQGMVKEISDLRARAEAAEALARGQFEQIEKQGHELIRRNTYGKEQRERAEAAEADAQYWKTLAEARKAHAQAAERQSDEAFAKGAEAMREACAKYMEERGWPTHAEIFRALPIPTQEGK